LSVALLANLFAYPFVLGLLPFVAKDIYGAGQAGLGVLAASFAFGCLLGSLVLSVSRTPLRPARTMLLAAAAWFLLTLAFGYTESVAAGAFVIALAGFAQSFCMVPLLAVMLRGSGDDIRGRLMGLRMLAVWGLPVGLMLSGPLIAGAGFAATATLYAVTGLLFTLLIAVRWRANLWPDAAKANVRL
jgi:MFS family permease